jgi:hypothetical protein
MSKEFTFKGKISRQSFSPVQHKKATNGNYYYTIRMQFSKKSADKRKRFSQETIMCWDEDFKDFNFNALRAGDEITVKGEMDNGRNGYIFTAHEITKGGE